MTEKRAKASKQFVAKELFEMLNSFPYPPRTVSETYMRRLYRSVADLEPSEEALIAACREIICNSVFADDQRNAPRSDQANKLKAP